MFIEENKSPAASPALVEHKMPGYKKDIEQIIAIKQQNLNS